MGGYISYYKLDKWFNSEFSKKEQDYMIMTYNPLSISVGDNSESVNVLTKGNHSSTDCTSMFLATLIGWFYKKEYTELCLKIANKAEEINDIENAPLLEKHFYYQKLIEFYYKLRSSEECLAKVLNYCKLSMEIAPAVAVAMKEDFPVLPRHVAYEQLAIIQKKMKNWDMVILICEKAKKEKWTGEWDKRIQEAKIKLDC